MMTSVLLILSLGAATIYALRFLAPQTSWPRSIVKTIPLASAGVLAVQLNAPLLLAAGMGLSAAGDFALSRDGERWFKAGLVAFLVAHLAYIALFLGLADLADWNAASWAGVGVLALFGLSYLAAIWGRLGSMRTPVAAYVGVILGMGVAAIAFGDLFAILGAVLFIVSDSLLALEMFVLKDRPRWIAPAVWETYIAAQAAIALPFLGDKLF